MTKIECMHETIITDDYAEFSMCEACSTSAEDCVKELNQRIAELEAFIDKDRRIRELREDLRRKKNGLSIVKELLKREKVKNAELEQWQREAVPHLQDYREGERAHKSFFEQLDKLIKQAEGK